MLCDVSCLLVADMRAVRVVVLACRSALCVVGCWLVVRSVVRCVLLFVVFGVLCAVVCYVLLVAICRCCALCSQLFFVVVWLSPGYYVCLLLTMCC